MAGSENEPNNSSSGEEQEVSSEGSESESEPNKTSTPPPSSNKFQLTPNSSSDESDSQSESVPDPSIKPLSSKPMDDDGSKKARSKNPTSRYSPPPIKPCTGKRPPAVADGGDLKRAKKKPAAPDPELADIGGEKKLLFQRLWSEENEIELIQGMINYVEEKGKDPVANVIDFHEFVKKSLHVDVNDRQVLAKVRRLKKKFENNVARVEKNGKVRSFSNPHEKKMYDLSKNLWGNDSNNNVVMSSKKVNAKVKVTPKTNKSRKSTNSGNENGEVEVPMNEVKPKVGQPIQSGQGLGQLDLMGLQVTDEGIMEKGLSGPKKAEMEGKWKNLKVQEIEHFLKKVDILKEQAEVVLNAITKSGGR